MPKFDLAAGADIDIEFEQSTINLKKLIKKTEFHPDGRIQLDDDREVINQKHNVIYVKEVAINVITEKGKKVKIGVEKINVNGGLVKGYHAVTGKQEDCVWRNSLNGPKRYHELVLKKAEIRRKNPTSRDQVTPTLEDAEFNEYIMYIECIKELKKKLPGNVEFYEWVEKYGVSVDDEGNIERDKKAGKTEDKDSTKKGKSKS